MQNALSSSKSEQQRASVEWRQQEGGLHDQLLQQADALQQTQQQIAALKAEHDAQQHCLQQQHAEVSQLDIKVVQNLAVAELDRFEAALRLVLLTLHGTLGFTTL